MKTIIAQFPITLFFLIISLGFNPLLTAQEQKITEESVSYPTYYFGDPNPLPAFVFNPKI
jgi:hypothetical protein